jgi:hypothetical protein
VADGACTLSRRLLCGGIGVLDRLFHQGDRKTVG